MKRLVGIVLVALLIPAVAQARDVYLNGVKLGSDVILKSQVFNGCEVKFDDKGDIWISVKGIKIQVQEAPPEPTAQPAATVTKRYWLVTKQTARGVTQYDIEVYVNGTLVKKVKSADDPTILEVTRFVKPGSNAVHLVSLKATGKRTSTSPEDYLEVVLGEGSFAEGVVTIEKPVVVYRRDASETANFADDRTFNSR